MPGIGSNWRPNPGTAPGRTEARVLRALKSLQDAGADPVPADAVVGWVEQWGWDPAEPAAYRWSASSYLREKCGFAWAVVRSPEGRYGTLVSPSGLEVIRADDAEALLARARALGMPEPTWSPTDGTIRCRFRDLECRGLIEWVRGKGARLTAEGRRVCAAMAEYGA